MRLALSLIVCTFLWSESGSAAPCINKFTRRSDGARQNLTLLTGKLTFQTAQQLAAAIRQRKAEPLEWVDESGKTIGRQFGELKIIRPMPVACDANSSGVIMTVTFASANPPSRKIFVKFDSKTTVAFDEQAE